MKRLLLLALLSVVLTGCATKTERGAYKEEANAVGEVENATEVITPTEEDVKETPQTENKLLYANNFTNNDNGDKIMASVTADKKLILMYSPSEVDSDNVLKYESRCSAAVLIMYGLVKSDNYTLSVSDDIHYCDCLIMKDSDGITIFSSDRDGTSHISTFDGTIGDWLNEAINNPSSVKRNDANVWIADTCDTIAKEIEGIYP